MSIPAKCPHCGAGFQVPDSLAGRRAKCAKCKELFDIPRTTVEPELPALVREQPKASPHARAASDGAAPAAPGAPDIATHSYIVDAITKPHRSFWKDAALSFAVPLIGPGPAVLTVLVVLSLVQFISSFGGVFGLVGRGIIAGWMCAYYFAVAQDTCTGKDELPSVAEACSDIGEIFMSLVRFIGSWVWVMLPAIIYAVIWASTGGAAGRRTDVIVCLSLVVLGAFFWPITALTVAIFGLSSSMLRYDKMISTVARAFPQYLALWLILLLSLAAAAAGTVALKPIATFIGLGSGFLSLLVALVLAAALANYFWVVAMRNIGLFYRHYKSKFVWQAE